MPLSANGSGIGYVTAVGAEIGDNLELDSIASNLPCNLLAGTIDRARALHDNCLSQSLPGKYQSCPQAGGLEDYRTSTAKMAKRPQLLLAFDVDGTLVSEEVRH